MGSYTLYIFFLAKKKKIITEIWTFPPKNPKKWEKMFGNLCFGCWNHFIWKRVIIPLFIRKKN
jgi:hypothetical protein